MKSYMLSFSFALLAFFGMSNEDQLGTSGDHLDLDAVMELFKKSDSIEEFEQELNSEKNGVNNLDLNQDGFVDYIRVIDYADGDVHALTLQVPYSDTESQDIAVIEIEKSGDEVVNAQIIGDETLYGKDYIIEPQVDSKTVNVYHWRPIRHIYSPSYVIWVSPWRYNRCPNWYRPWRPVVWSVYRTRHVRYHVHYRRVKIYRCRRAHGHYYKHKVHSHTFKAKHVHHPVNKQKAVNKKSTKTHITKNHTKSHTKSQAKRPSVKPTQKKATKTSPNRQVRSTPKNPARSNKSNRSSKSGRRR
ncbi:MAG: hypothetical protein MK105_05580 [Crocinitomicaceae bacterium]|nr:hypothetical protein [Crocinitomicaceae bacterium]